MNRGQSRDKDTLGFLPVRKNVIIYQLEYFLGLLLQIYLSPAPMAMLDMPH
jgi:hypothetical protein